MNIKILISIPLFVFTSYTYSQDYSTWGEIYDYETGDIFHFAGGTYTPYQWWEEWRKNHLITDKIFSIDSSSVTYTIFIEKISRNFDYPDWVFASYYNDVIYDNLDSFYVADTIYYSSNYNGRKISFSEFTVYMEKYDCDEYVDGCGHAYKYRSGWQPFWEDSSALVYYKKGDEEWGTPNIIVGIDEDIMDGDHVMLFPNPASDKIQISLNNDLQINQVQIYNNIGKLVLNQSNSFDNINISNLPPGLYIVEIIAEDWNVKRKLIVE